jgi:hypothetical protein
MSERVAAKFGTLCVHAGNEPNCSTGAVVPPISLASTFAQSGLGKLYGEENLDSHGKGFEYSRTGNPTRYYYTISTLSTVIISNTNNTFILLGEHSKEQSQKLSMRNMELLSLVDWYTYLYDNASIMVR